MKYIDFKKRCLAVGAFGALLLNVAVFPTHEAFAASDELMTTGGTTVEDSGTTTVLDPENPNWPAIPEPGPATKGSLRFDYISNLTFGRVPIKETNRTYYGLAQYFMDGAEPRGFFIQISDKRETSTGWNLQVKQTRQFTNSDGKDLNGAVLSFNKGWITSPGEGVKPLLSRDIDLVNIDQSYQVATSEYGNGNGVWLITFGASPNNKVGQTTTMEPVLNKKDGSPLLDAENKKPIYSNSAITLQIPDKTEIQPVQYQTELIWSLSKLP